MSPARKRDDQPDFSEYGPRIRVDGGLRARSTRGAIGEHWWSQRFVAVLESFALGGRLTRGRTYARQGQVLRMTLQAGLVAAEVQGSRPDPYHVTIRLAPIPELAWAKIEIALAEQARYAAQLLSGHLPAGLEEVCAAAKGPLFPTRLGELKMRCDCPDATVPCKHLAATFYLLAESFDDDPFRILAWRGRSRSALLARLGALRGTAPAPPGGPPFRADSAEPRPHDPRSVSGAGATSGDGRRVGADGPAAGAGVAFADLPSPPLADVLDRFWVPPVALGARPPVLDADSDLVLRQLSTPSTALGGPNLTERLRTIYERLGRPTEIV